MHAKEPRKIVVSFLLERTPPPSGQKILKTTDLQIYTNFTQVEKKRALEKPKAVGIEQCEEVFAGRWLILMDPGMVMEDKRSICCVLGISLCRKKI